MPIRHYKPITAGQRKSTVQVFSDITKDKPSRSLVRGMVSSNGRGYRGKITVRHRGGGDKRLYRLVDFRQDKFDAPAEVKSIEYDPNRGPRIALIEYSDGEKSYILAAEGMKAGDRVISTKNKIEVFNGMRTKLENIPIGMFVYNVELTPGKGGQMVRGAGSAAQLQTIEGGNAQLKMPSGEVRLIKKECLATIGRLSNSDYNLIRWGKAGRRRHLGWRPRVKGKNMNPVDHPHGGGEGHSPIGLKSGPKTKWGKIAMGVKTRRPNRQSDKMIIQRRKKQK